MKRDAITFKPALVQINVGYENINDDSLIDWFPVLMTRNDAAQALRAARRRKLDIGITTKGYCISGGLHEGWDYSRRER